MTDNRSRRVLIVSEGSGGHLIPAIEIARNLAFSGARVCLLYPKRPKTATVFNSAFESVNGLGVELVPITFDSKKIFSVPVLKRTWMTRQIWRVAKDSMSRFNPDIVVGFGGWVSVPVVVLAKLNKIPVLIHEQNVRLGRANRLLSRLANKIALSFDEMKKTSLSRHKIITGLPIRKGIGTLSRQEAASRFGLDPESPTVLVLGGSQGSSSINRIVCESLEHLSDDERRSWQFLHLAGASDARIVSQVYASSGIRYWSSPHLSDMADAYALADIVVSRAGASTIAELSFCAVPAVLIPYPYAHNHQLYNARLVESLGAGICLEEKRLNPKQLANMMRILISDCRLRRMMGKQMQLLSRPNATDSLSEAIFSLGYTRQAGMSNA